MEVRDLTHDERLALVGLSEMVLLADNTVTDNEVARVDALVDQIGELDYRRLLDECDTRFAGESEFKDFLTTITGQEARELIFETVLEEVLGDVARHKEFELLEWLRAAWTIDLQFGEPEDDPS